MSSSFSRLRPRASLSIFMVLPVLTTLSWSQVVFETPSDDRPLFPNLRVGAGATMVQSTEIDSLSFLYLAGRGTTNEMLVPISLGPESDMEFTVGPSVGLALGGGMRMPDWLHLELETGFSMNGFDFQADGIDFEGELWQIPAVVNATVPWKISDAWEAFGGLGIGAMFGVLNLEGEPFWLNVGDEPPELVTVRGAHFTATAMAQAFAGVRYRFNPASALSLSYRFRGSTPPLWNGDFRAGGDESDWELDLSRLYSHTVHLMYELKW